MGSGTVAQSIGRPASASSRERHLVERAGVAAVDDRLAEVVQPLEVGVRPVGQLRGADEHDDGVGVELARGGAALGNSSSQRSGSNS